MAQKPTRYDRELAHDSRWRAPFNVLQTNLQEIDAAMDVEAAANFVVDYGADTWLLNAGGILSFYPTDLPSQTRNPLLGLRPSGDLFGDAVAAAKRRGLKVIARLDMSKVSPALAAAHPEWLYLSPTGERQVYNTLSSTCPSAEYYQRHTFDVLDEVLARYDIDGVFFNWFNFNERDYDEVMHGPCHCDSCVTAFAEFSGDKALPTEMSAASPTIGVWREFTATVLNRLSARIADHVSATGRDIGVIIRSGAPIEYVEGNNHFRAMPGKELWPYATAEAGSALAATRPDASVLVNCVAFIDATYRMGQEEPEHFAQYLLQGMARGGNPSAYFFGEPGRIPMERAISLGREVMRFRSAHTEIYQGLASAAGVALVRPGYASAAPGAYWDVVEEFRGVYSALVEGHIPFDVVPVEHLGRPEAAATLDRYTLLILPDVGALRTGATVIDDFVANGGKLLVTGSSGVGKDGGVELRCLPALRPYGPATEGDELRSTYSTVSAQSRVQAFGYDGDVLPIFGRYQRFVWSPQAERVGMVLPRAPFGPPELSYGHVTSGDPDHVRMEFGKGHVTHVPWTVGRTYREFGKTDARDHLVGIVRALVDSDINPDLPDQVEIVHGRNNDAEVIHLINHTGLRRRSYGAHVPVIGGSLRLHDRRGDPVVATAHLAGQRLDPAVDGADLVIALPRLEQFEVVTITPEAR